MNEKIWQSYGIHLNSNDEFATNIDGALNDD